MQCGPGSAGIGAVGDYKADEDARYNHCSAGPARVPQGRTGAQQHIQSQSSSFVFSLSRHFGRPRMRVRFSSETPW